MLSAYCVDFLRLIIYPEPARMRERVAAAFVKIRGAIMDSLFRDYPVVVEFPVAWGEIDAMNHVDNIVLRKRILDIQKSSPQP